MIHMILAFLFGCFCLYAAWRNRDLSTSKTRLVYHMTHPAYSIDLNERRVWHRKNDRVRQWGFYTSLVCAPICFAVFFIRLDRWMT